MNADTAAKANKMEIESITVTVNGELIDAISFSDSETAEAYKRGVRRWAEKRGVTARVWTQTMEVETRQHARLAVRLGLAS